MPSGKDAELVRPVMRAVNFRHAGLPVNERTPPLTRLKPAVRAEPEELPFSKAAGSEPLPGYKLIEPLGRGGFAEVWKCEVPGGLYKAIKFVHGNLNELGGSVQAQQELAALQHVKSIRHPFLLSMERVEIVGGELMIVMELADKNLLDLLNEYQGHGQAGIPRDELLGYCLEAAEVLDLMNAHHDLQHLDIKPGNLFLVSGHVKVADFGLVNNLKDRETNSQTLSLPGVTPLYASPEVLQGRISVHSDQYSLAVAYQELLTGKLPFEGKNARQLMMQHVTAPPRLEGLPAADRRVLTRALAKKPEERYASCIEFVQSLVFGLTPGPAARSGGGSIIHMQGQQKQVVLRAKSSPALARPAPETDTDVRETSPAGTPLSSSVFTAIPGYRFLECLSQSPLGEAWKVQTEDGRECMAHMLPGFIVGEPRAETPLLDFVDKKHPALPAMQLFRSPNGRIVLVTDTYDKSLRDRFQECLNQGQRGIPRDELLGYLETAAAALDQLHEQHGLRHLGLSPRHLVLRGGQLGFVDFGLLQLVWLATGQPAAQLPLRYAAPEFLETGAADTADQYSLALIYAELLTGVQPRLSRGGARHAPGKSAAPIDLDFLPAVDRAPLARALDPDPAKRFAHCTALAAALRGSKVRSADSLYDSLPNLIPFRTLFGEPAPKGLRLPTLDEFIADVLQAAGGFKVATYENFQYLLLPDHSIEHDCLIRTFPGGLQLRLREFARQWNLEVMQDDGHVFAGRIPMETSFWQRVQGLKAGLEIRLDLEPLDSTSKFKAIFRVQPFGSTNKRLFQQLLDAGPPILESLRLHLQVDPDQRGDLRCVLDLPVRVYPVQPDLELGEVVDGSITNISRHGLCLRVPASPAAAQAYLHLHTLVKAVPFALLIHMHHATPWVGGGFDVGASLARDRRGC